MTEDDTEKNRMFDHEKVGNNILRYAWLLLILIPFLYLAHCQYQKNQSDIDFSPLLEKYTKNKVTPASEVVKDIFPDIDQNEYPTLCTMVMENPYLLDTKFQVNFIDYDGKILDAQFFSTPTLYYYPYYIFLIDKTGKKYKNVSINFYNNNYTDVEGGICNRNIELSKVTEDKISKTIRDDKSITYKNVKIKVSNKIYIEPMSGFKIPCVPIQDLKFYTYNAVRHRFGKSDILKYYGFAMKDQINTILKGEKNDTRSK